MSKDPRILNITRGFRLKANQVYKAIENCSCTWVEKGVSVRDLTLAESIQMRNEQAKVREPLASMELPGLSYSGPQDYALIHAANEFVTSAV